MSRLFATLFLCLNLHACSETVQDDRIAVDTILHNGKVITIDADLSLASAVAVNGTDIVAVGGAELLESYKSANMVDLGGKVLMPGFIDSHTHLRGRPRRHIDLARTRSIEELKGQVSTKAIELGAGEWITGYGWSEDVMAELRRPLRNDLDEAAPDNPVLLTRAGGHSAVANSMALRLAEVTPTTPQPESGVIERGEDGELNGVIRERKDIVSRLIPEPTYEDVREDLIRVLKEQLSLGITSFTNASFSRSVESYPEWEYIYSRHRGSLPRGSIQVAWQGPEAMAAFGKKSGDGDEHLRVGPIKIIVDGGFTGPAAYTKEPYKGETEYRGKLSLTLEELNTIIREGHAAG